MPEKFPITSDLMRRSTELLIAEIREFYAASEPIPFDIPEPVSA